MNPETLTRKGLEEIFERSDYVAGEDILTPTWLSLRMGKPLLVEGEPGSGKTELGKVLAAGLDTELIRLQCYRGLSAENALYEWNYTKQLLAVQAGEASPTDGETSVFSEEYLLERPLLRALRADGETPPVLLIDEVDRADEPFEAFLLEVLSDWQVSIPELGSISTSRPPVVVLTSNRTRGLSEALKRRCLYLHIPPPSPEKEQRIINRKVKGLSEPLIAQLVGIIRRMREEPLVNPPGVAEVLDWARALRSLRDGHDEGLQLTELEQTLGCLLKETEDTRRIQRQQLEDWLKQTRIDASSPP